MPVSDVCGKRVKLQKRGREFVGLSPFNNEKSPSFTVNDQKGFYHCFSSGKHGDVFSFVMATEGLSFPEAVEKLARQVGMEVPQETPQERARTEKRAGLHDVMEAACKVFERSLDEPGGKAARSYLEGRGLDNDTIRGFRLGYAPQGNAMRVALEGNGITEALLLEGGLLRRPDDGRAAYPFFRDRVIFPITDRRGRVIGFGGRMMGDGNAAKYINSPDTPLFDKGRTLYNLADARQAAHDGHEVIVAEGYMDVIALVSAGFKGAVAPLGTALTETQLGELWRLAPEPILCFDGDAAGGRAAMRAAERALAL
ncbi:MAG: DNA primase, partial [Alphaproteobacteria bacterium]